MKNYTIIKNELLEAHQLTPQATYLFIILLKFAGNKNYCFPSQTTLAKKIGFKNPRHIRTLLKELIEAGLVIKKRYGFNRPNTYFVAKEYVIYSDGNPSSPHIGSRVPIKIGSTFPTNSKRRKLNIKNKNDFEPLINVLGNKLQKHDTLKVPKPMVVCQKG